MQFAQVQRDTGESHNQTPSGQLVGAAEVESRTVQLQSHDDWPLVGEAGRELHVDPPPIEPAEGSPAWPSMEQTASKVCTTATLPGEDCPSPAARRAGLSPISCSGVSELTFSDEEDCRFDTGSLQQQAAEWTDRYQSPSCDLRNTANISRAQSAAHTTAAVAFESMDADATPAALSESPCSERDLGTTKRLECTDFTRAGDHTQGIRYSRSATSKVSAGDTAEWAEHAVPPTSVVTQCTVVRPHASSRKDSHSWKTHSIVASVSRSDRDKHAAVDFINLLQRAHNRQSEESQLAGQPQQ